MEIHIFRNGAEQGPYDEATARQLLEEGVLLPTDHAWHEELPDWVPLSRILRETDDRADGERTPSEITTLKITLPRSVAELPASLPAPAPMPAPQPARPAPEPASAKQKAFLSYMGIPFPSDLTKERGAHMVNDAMENPGDPARLARWAEDRLRLHPDIFAADLQARRENRPQRFHELVETQGADCFQEVSKAHCQVLVQYLDVKFPNWDAREHEAVWNYFFPAIAEKFPQLVNKHWRGKLHFPEGPKVAAELKHSVPEPGPLLHGHTRGRRALRVVALLVLLTVIGAAGFYLVQHPELIVGWRKLVEKSPSTGTAPAEPGAPSTTAETKPAEPAPPAPPPEPSKTADTKPAEPPPSPMNSAPMSSDPPPASPPAPSNTALFAPPAPAAPAPPPPAPVRSKNTLTVTQPVEVQLAYGKVRINPGTLLPVLSQEGALVMVKYMNTTVAIPLSYTDWR